jgi:hypothetical protein
VRPHEHRGRSRRRSMGAHWAKKALGGTLALLPLVTLTRLAIGTTSLLTLLLIAGLPSGVVLNAFYLRLRLASFAVLYPEAERAVRVRLALAGLRFHSTGLSVWSFYVLSYGGVLVFAFGTYGGAHETLAGLMMILWGLVPRLRMSVPPAMIYLGASDSSKAAYEQVSHVCMPWPCLSLMRTDQVRSPRSRSIDRQRTAEDSYRAGAASWNDLVSLWIEAVPLIVMDARVVTEHLLTELAMVRSHRRETESIYLTLDDRSAPLLDEFCRRNPGFVPQNRELRLRLPQAVRLVRYVTRGSFAASSPDDQLSDKVFLAVHDGAWSCSDTLTLQESRRFNDMVRRDSWLQVVLDQEELARWNQPNANSRRDWRLRYLDGIAAQAQEQGFQAFIIRDASTKRAMFTGCTRAFAGRHYGSDAAA